MRRVSWAQRVVGDGRAGRPSRRLSPPCDARAGTMTSSSPRKSRQQIGSRLGACSIT